MIHCRARRAFSLVELSIVLVILGLLVGGVLSGKSLIESAAIKSQISQLESFSIATHTFRDKYFFLPGDLTKAFAAQAGFAVRGNYAGEGDGNGVLECADMDAPGRNEPYYQCGENLLFWRDLSQAGLIPGSFTTANYSTVGSVTASSTPNIKAYLPEGKISGNYVFVTGGSQGLDGNFLQDGRSYFALQSVSTLWVDWVQSSTMGLTVAQAYNIDMKLDDGKPLTGKVAALRQNNVIITTMPNAVGAGSASAASATSCVDNGNSATSPAVYTLANSDQKNCSLFFDMVN